MERNDPCHCGSGKKYKKCCLSADEEKTNPYSIIAKASQYPLEDCLIREDWQGDGLATIMIIRKNPYSGKFLFCMLLVDVLCLGVKNAYYNAEYEASRIDQIIEMQPTNMKREDYEYCRGLIFGSIDFARKFGFEPHEDWEKAKEFVEPDRPYTTNYNFGKNGKPFYIPGPEDDEKAIKKILPRQLSVLHPQIPEKNH